MRKLFRAKPRNSALLLTLLLFLADWAPADARSHQIDVRLFSSHVPPQAVIVRGPFKIASQHGRLLPAGDYRVRATGYGLCLEAMKPKSRPGGQHSADSHLKIYAPAFTLSALDPRPRQPGGFCTGTGLPIVFDERLVRHYFGTVRFFRVRLAHRQAAIGMRNAVDTRDYVASVVGSESLPGFPLEALKSQAVLTLTRVARLDPKIAVVDSTEQESYFGADFESKEVKEAVQSVWGRVLTFDGKIIKPFYHSTCAGKTSSGEEVFGKAAARMPYLRCVTCRFCKPSPFWKPTVRTVPRADFEKVFGKKMPTVLTSDCASRPRTLRLFDRRGYSELSGYQFWLKLGQKFGWDKAPGTRFKLSLSGQDKGAVRIESTGAGHGVGLCQWGAAEQARQGKSYEQILSFYFPGSKVESEH